MDATGGGIPSPEGTLDGPLDAMTDAASAGATNVVDAIEITPALGVISGEVESEVVESDVVESDVAGATNAANAIDAIDAIDATDASEDVHEGLSATASVPLDAAQHGVAEDRAPSLDVAVDVDGDLVPETDGRGAADLALAAPKPEPTHLLDLTRFETPVVEPERSGQLAFASSASATGGAGAMSAAGMSAGPVSAPDDADATHIGTTPQSSDFDPEQPELMRTGVDATPGGPGARSVDGPDGPEGTVVDLTAAETTAAAKLRDDDDESELGLVDDFFGAVSGLAIGRRKKIGAILLAGWLVLVIFTMTFIRGRVESELESSARSVLTLNGQPGVDVQASGLTVTLKGFVESPEDRDRAGELVKSRFGVRSVKNNLVIDAAKVASVQADAAAPDPATGDATSSIAPTTLKPQLPVRGPSVDVSFRPGADGSVGTVDVRGAVPSTAAKDALFARVSNVVPVGRIASNVQIPTTPTEQPDMQDYRRLGSFLEIVAKAKTPDVRLSYKDGDLTMSGSVSDAYDLSLIRAEARNLVGTGTINDTMTVSGIVEGTEAASDSTLAADGATSTSVAGDPTSSVPTTTSPLEIEGVGRTDTPAAKTAQVAVDGVIAGKVIAFEKNKALLTSDGRELLNELATALLASPDKTVKFEISGHTDDKGSESSNLDLSTRRAEAVRDALIAKGVAASQLVAKGYGESQPIADNETESGRSQNRRIQVRAAS